MKGSVLLSGVLFLILIGMFYSNNDFFLSMYNSKLGRFVLVVILVVITLNSVLLGILLLIVIIVLSQKKIIVKKEIKPEVEKEQISFSEVLTRTINENPSENFSVKNYNKYLYKKSKKNGGVNILQMNELMRPKESNSQVIIPNIPNIEISPYTNKNFYNLN